MNKSLIFSNPSLPGDSVHIITNINVRVSFYKVSRPVPSDHNPKGMLMGPMDSLIVCSTLGHCEC